MVSRALEREDSWSELDDLGKQILEAGGNSGIIGGDTQHLVHTMDNRDGTEPLVNAGAGKTQRFDISLLLREEPLIRAR